ncbi:MAG: hypothetical protein IJF38_04455 [Clostridia bacterium]|nr:hypothetical protein [Clostridia bacterium]
MIRIELAGLPIEIDNRMSHIERISEDYRTEREPIISVCASDADIECERAMLDTEYPRAMLESTVIFRKIAEQLPKFGAFVFHGAVIAYGGRAYAVTARSGVGKTTHLRLWLSRFGEECHILNGDKPVIRFIDGVPYACATPWRGKEGYGVNELLPLSGIALLRRSERNYYKKLPPAIGCVELMSQIYMPKDNTSARLTLKGLNSLVASVPLYELFVNMDEDAAEVARNMFLNN